MNIKELFTNFENLTDPRIERKKEHKLFDIIVIALSTVLCGGETWEAMEEFGNAKYDFFKQFCELKNGIPSHDTFNRVFSSLDPIEFEQCLIEWTETIAKHTEGRLISIDGKTVRNAEKDKNRKSLVHIVNAWCNENELVLGQSKVDEKSNEITAIPKLLKIIDIKRAVVSIDAMGCQTKIAEAIREKEADYFLALKENQPMLYEWVQGYLKTNKKLAKYVKQVDTGHGRVEIRECWSMDFTYSEWKDLHSICMIRSERKKKSTGESSIEERYYISSTEADAEKHLNFARGHWGIENKLHWRLDVVFREDELQKRNKNAARNFSTLRKMGMNILLKDKSKGSMPTKRLKAGWDNTFLTKLLQNINKF